MKDKKDLLKLKNLKSLINIFLIFIISFSFISCSTINEIELETINLFEDTNTEDTKTEDTKKEDTKTIVEDGHYTSKEDVALYIYTYDKLPDNYISKSEARDLGWDSSAGNLWDVTDEKSIGGDKFGNREGLLPSKDGRHFFECDINYQGGYRGSERIVYSNDGLIFYTPDHYETFEQLYGGN